MKAFPQLTERGKIVRLRRAALEALTHYPVGPQKLTFVANDCHCIFRLRTNTGTKYAVRVCAAVTSAQTATSEMLWLESLHVAGVLSVPRPLRTHASRLSVTVRTGGLDAARRCVVYTWVPGSILGRRISPENMWKFGELAARVHAASEAFAPPKSFKARTWSEFADYMEHRAEIPAWFRRTGFGDLLTNDRLDLFRATEDCLRRTLATLAREPGKLQLVHGDLHTWNATACRRSVYLFDFHSFCWGRPVQDVALAISWLQNRSFYHALDASLLESFRLGYASIKLWPSEWDDQIVGLLRGQLLAHMCNVLQLDCVSTSEKTNCVVRTAELLDRLRRDPYLASLCR